VHVVVAVEEQVSGLDVPVDDAVSVCVVEGLGGLLEPVQEAVDRLRPLAGDAVVERSAVQVLHDDERPLVPLADIEDRDRVRLAREPRRGERLSGEAAADGLVLGEALREHLDRHRAPERLVDGAENLAHAAVADPFGVAVARRKQVHAGRHTRMKADDAHDGVR
jgi:hypothetical protein